MKNPISLFNWQAKTLHRFVGIALFSFASLDASSQTNHPTAANSDNLGDLSIEQLMDLRVEKVYSASKYEQNVTQAPASVTIVTADNIRKSGDRTLADVLRGSGGWYVTYDRNYSNLGVRGFARPGDFNTRVLLLVDGHRMNDDLYSSALIGPEAIIDVDLIDRVEIIRGPSSSIYGNSAFFGVVNVVTKTGEKINGVQASVAGGTFETYKGRLTYGKKLTKGIALVLSASVSDSAGAARLYFPEFDTPLTNRGIAQDADGEYAMNLFGSLVANELTLTAAYSRRDKDIPTASFGTVFNDGREWTSDERLFVDLKYDHTLNFDARITARIYYDRYGYRADYPLNFGPPSDPAFLAHDDHYGDGVGTEIQWTQQLLDHHRLVTGAEFRQSLNLSQSSFSGDPRTYSFLDNRHGNSMGLYVQDEFTVRPEVIVNAGLRYDHFNTSGGTLNPRLGLIFTPRPTTIFKLLYGRAYRTPNAYELYLESPFYSKSNPALRPEVIQTYEAVYEQYLPAGFRFGFSGYYYSIKDLISQEIDPSDGFRVFHNVETVRARGVEIELERKSANGWEARTSYALQRSEDGRTGQELNNSPRHLIKLNLTAPLLDKRFFGGLEIQYVSSVKTLSARRTGGFAVVNLTLLSAAVAKNFEVSVTAYNLLDRSYGYPGSTANIQDVIPQDGRTLRLKFVRKF